MALPYNEINSFCMNYVMPVLTDNIFRATPITWRFFGKAAKWHGGPLIQAPIEYAANTNAISYAGSGILTVAAVEIATKASLPPRQYNVALNVTGIEEEENKGDARVLDMIKAKMDNAEKSLKDLFGTHFFATQTSTNLDGVGGIAASVSGTPYAGIDPADFAGWRTNNGAGPKAVGGNLTFANLMTEYNLTRNDADKPTLMVTTDTIWAGIEQLFFKPYMKYEDKEMANLGFENITIHGTPCVFDSKCTAQYLFLFNEKYLKVYVMPGMNLKFIPFQSPTNYDYKLAHIRWYGNLLCTNLKRQGVLSGITGVA